TLAAPFDRVADEATDPEQEAHYISDRNKPQEPHGYRVLEVLDSDNPGHRHPDAQSHSKDPPANSHAPGREQEQQAGRGAVGEYQTEIAPGARGAGAPAPSRLVQKQIGQACGVEHVVDDVFG